MSTNSCRSAELDGFEEYQLRLSTGSGAAGYLLATTNQAGYQTLKYAGAYLTAGFVTIGVMRVITQ